MYVRVGMSEPPPTTLTALALAIQQATSSGRDTVATPSVSGASSFGVPGPSPYSGTPNTSQSGSASASGAMRM